MKCAPATDRIRSNMREQNTTARSVNESHKLMRSEGNRSQEHALWDSLHTEFTDRQHQPVVRGQGRGYLWEMLTGGGTESLRGLEILHT